MKDIFTVAQANSIPVFLDGARLFNASVATEIPISEFAKCANSLQICLSKGLGAPVGSVIAGSHDWINNARKWRKRLGGGMRQAGIIAAPGIIALQTMIERLAEDHENARYFAEGLASISCFDLNPALVETNIILAKLKSIKALDFSRFLSEKGILANPFSNDTIRFTTHKDISRNDLEEALSIINNICNSCS